MRVFERSRQPHPSRSTILLLSVLLFALFACDREARAVPTVKLSRATGTLHETFRDLSQHAVRELPDGRVLVSETALRSHLLVADFESDSVSEIAAPPTGWGEMNVLVGVFRIARDSSMLIVAPHTWLTLVGTNVADSFAISHSALIEEQGFDSLGSLLVATFGPPVRRDSATYAMTRRSLKEITATVQVALRAEPAYSPATVYHADRAYYSYAAWASAEKVVLFPDGWIAVARHRPYRVDWRSPDGQWMNGAALPFVVRPVTEREQRAFHQTESVHRADASDGRGRYDRFPQMIPPFTSDDDLLASPDGKLLIPRTRTADHPGMRYDIVNRAGILERRLTIGNANRILGFGTSAVYVSTVARNGDEQISRHPWP